jgi:2-phosphoglycerate kinase
MNQLEGFQTPLPNVHWIGGSSGAGKSTVARLLAQRTGAVLYSTDDVMTAHAARLAPSEAPLLHKFKVMNMDERWLLRTPVQMLDSFHWWNGEGFNLVVDDLLQLEDRATVIVEGHRVLPRLVKPLLAGRNRAVWLIPTPEFRRAAFDSRGSTWDIAGKTSDPPGALWNLLERDRLFGDRLEDEVLELGLHLIQVDRSRTVDDLAALVSQCIGL